MLVVALATAVSDVRVSTVVAAVVVVVRKEALVQVKLVQLLDEAYLKKDTPDTTEKGSQSQIKTHKRQTS